MKTTEISQMLGMCQNTMVKTVYRKKTYSESSNNYLADDLMTFLKFKEFILFVKKHAKELTCFELQQTLLPLYLGHTLSIKAIVALSCSDMNSLQI